MMVPSCFWASLTIAFVAFICNIVAVIYQKQLFPGKIRPFLINLAISNIALLVGYPTPLLFQQTKQSRVSLFMATLIPAFFNILYFITVWMISNDRFVAVKYPTKYNIYCSIKHRKMIIIFTWGLSLVLALFIAALTSFGEIVKAFSVTMLVFMLMTLFDIVIIYGYIIRKTAKRQHSLNESVNNRLAVGKQTYHKRRERNMVSLTVGIATNFILLNAPLVIYTIIFNDNRRVLDCQSSRGKAFNVLFALRALSKLTDPLLYFYVTYKLNKHRVLVDVARQNTASMEIMRAHNNQGTNGEIQAIPEELSKNRPKNDVVENGVDSQL